VCSGQGIPPLLVTRGVPHPAKVATIPRSVKVIPINEPLATAFRFLSKNCSGVPPGWIIVGVGHPANNACLGNRSIRDVPSGLISFIPGVSL
jgi:hypothetical protein